MKGGTHSMCVVCLRKNEREIAALDVVQKGASFFLFELLVDLNLYRKDKRKLRLSVIYQF